MAANPNSSQQAYRPGLNDENTGTDSLCLRSSRCDPLGERQAGSDFIIYSKPCSQQAMGD